MRMQLPADVRQQNPSDAQSFLADAEPGRRILDLGRSDQGGRMLRDVLEGLSAHPQKWVSPTYFYDAFGSQLYERITGLAEYYPTRLEAELLRRVAPDVAKTVGTAEIVELGSGSSAKTRTLLEAAGVDRRVVTYIPIDVSRSIVEASTMALREAYPLLKVLGVIGQYDEALDVLPPAAERLFVFLGGTIGNFTPEVQAAFFARLAQAMPPGNHLLLGFDRRPHEGKPEVVIHRAYNDEAGVTAQFNLNLLARLNRDLGADFVLSNWCHRAVYNAQDDQIEMYLDSLTDQVVHFPAAARSIRFARGEALLTELSRKFDPGELADWFAERGFRCVSHWSDASEYVGLLLLRRDAER